MPTVKFKVGALFFDSAKIRRAVDAAKRRVMSAQGAFVRTAARSSIRKGKKPSRPGSPPHSHIGTLKKMILFAYEPTAESVVVGPALVSRPSAQANVGGETTPQRLEEGGAVITTEVFTRKRGWSRVSARTLRRMKNPRTRKRRVHTRRRPYMVPALEKGLGDLAKKWKNSVR